MKMDNSEPEKIGALMAAYQNALHAARDSERIYKRDCAVAEKTRRALVRFRAEQMGQFDDLLEVQRCIQLSSSKAERIGCTRIRPHRLESHRR